MADLTTHMPNGKARRIWIVEGGYCSDTRCEQKLEEKEAQHTALEVALKEYGYDVTLLPIILGVSGSIYKTTKHALGQLGIEHGPANILCASCTNVPLLHWARLLGLQALEGKHIVAKLQY